MSRPRPTPIDQTDVLAPERIDVVKLCDRLPLDIAADVLRVIGDLWPSATVRNGDDAYVVSISPTDDPDPDPEAGLLVSVLPPPLPLARALVVLHQLLGAELDPSFDGVWSDYYNDPDLKAAVGEVEAAYARGELG